MAARVLVVFGTRPEAIKLAPVISALRANPGAFEVVVAVTAQHRDLLDRALEPFGIVPDHDLDLMRHGQSPAELLARAVSGIGALVAEIQPRTVVVQGDTTTTLAGALAGFYGGAMVAHVEAGLRTGDKHAPFPEEMNRRLATQLADVHFAPTGLARDRLLAEGVSPDAIEITGNTAVDAVLAAVQLPYEFEDPRLAALAAGVGGRFLLVTAHRRESWGAPMQDFLLGIRDVLDAEPDLGVVFPVHPNRAVRDVAEAVLGGHDRALLIEPLGYEPFVKLMAAATIIVSDSGGVQEEAPSLNVPVLVLRDVTERPEALETGAIALAGTSREGVSRAVLGLLRDPAAYRAMAGAPNPFGDGHAAERIAASLARRLGASA